MPFSVQASYLTAARRARLLADLHAGRADWDLVVLGGGVTGAGIALDAQLRGLQVLLVEAHDLAFGTSRWSSKLAHGGLRYLATGDVGIARRSAAERGTLMEVTAPHLTRRLPQVVPVLDGFSLTDKVLPRLGFLAGDVLRMLARTSSRTLPRSRMISARRVRELCPTVRRSGLRAGFLNYDGQLVDDARLVTTIARTAAGYGAEIATYTRALQATGTEVVLRDELGGTETTVRARAVVNAAGVWVGELQPGFEVSPSRGSHVIVPAAALGHPTGSLTVPIPGSVNRFCFILPAAHGRCYIGLTDEPNPGPLPEVPQAPDEDVDWILSVVNRALDTQLGGDDVIGTFCGLRPLLTVDDAVADTGRLGSSATAELSRGHAVLTAPNGLVTVAGGKLTEYRLMAEQTVDAVVQRLAMPDAAPLSACATATTPLLGAPHSAGTRGVSEHDLAGLPASLVSHYGHEAPQVLRMAQCERPLEQITPELEVTRAEIEFALRCEGALSVSDVLDRRSRIGLVAADRAAAEPVVRELAALVGVELFD